MENIKNKTKSIVWVLFLVALLIIGVLTSQFSKSYSTAKTESEKFLAQEQAEMEKFALSMIEREDILNKYNDIQCIGSTQEGGVVAFQMGIQSGKVEGQVWYLVYTNSGLLFDETEKYEKEDTNEAIFEKAEKIDDHWWFWWRDHDGASKRSFK